MESIRYRIHYVRMYRQSNHGIQLSIILRALRNASPQVCLIAVDEAFKSISVLDSLRPSALGWNAPLRQTDGCAAPRGPGLIQGLHLKKSGHVERLCSLRRPFHQCYFGQLLSICLSSYEALQQVAKHIDSGTGGVKSQLLQHSVSIMKKG